MQSDSFKRYKKLTIFCGILRNGPCMIKLGTRASKMAEALKVEEDSLEGFHLGGAAFKADLPAKTWTKFFRTWRRSSLADKGAWVGWVVWGACSHPIR